MLVIDENDESLGVMSSREAFERASERNFDLVEVNPAAKTPVCRFMDYGKYKYEQARAERKNKEKRKVQEISEVKLKPKIGDEDFRVKAKTVQRLLGEGNRVKVSIRFRGREVVHTDLAIKMMERLYEIVESNAIIMQKPQLEGRQMLMVLAPNPNKANAEPAQPAKAGNESAKPAKVNAEVAKPAKASAPSGQPAQANAGAVQGAVAKK